MPPTSKQTQGHPIAAKAKEISGKMKAQRIAKSGLTTRVRGHVSARGKRAQGRSDSK